MSTMPSPEKQPFDVAAASFHPRHFLANPHLQTIAGNFLPRANHLPTPQSVFVEVAPADAATGMQLSSRVLCHCHWQPEIRRAHAPTAIIVHGLEGSSNSQYVCGNADKLWYSGANVIRMNMRNCGGTEALSPTLYHSGLSADVLAVMRFFIEREHLTSISLVGYSMGGNLVLKLAGDLGLRAPVQLRSVVGVSPVIDLANSADALHETFNRIYERRFLKNLLKRFRRKSAIFPTLYDVTQAIDIRSLREFDDRITAPHSGFTGADDYYFRAASARVLHHIAVPTLILHALDDPFIRLTPASRTLLLANPYITLLEPNHGGHCAFLAQPDLTRGNDGYWAEHTALKFILANS